MSSSSDSEEFYDAEDSGACQLQRRSSKLSRENSISYKANSEPNLCKTVNEEQNYRIGDKNSKQENGDLIKANLGGRKRFKELRKKLQNDDEDGQASCITPPDSQTSSVEGIFATNNRTSHPFRIIEHDALSLQSINSLGRIGRILGGLVDNTTANVKEAQIGASASTLSTSSESASSSKNVVQYQNLAALSENAQPQKVIALQEPDVIASTKSSNSLKVQLESKKEIPVAPPRRKKKKNKNVTSLLSLPPVESTSAGTFSNSNLASPASTIESLTREFEDSLDKMPTTANVRKSLHSDKSSISSQSSKSSTLKSVHSLDLRQAIKGQYVVKPQDDDKFKAAKSSREEMEFLQLDDRKETDKQPNVSPRASKSRGSVGHNSLGSHRDSRHVMSTDSRERRRSAGDENMLKQMNICVRTRTDSGKRLTDREILEQVTVLNLDTGERVPLSVAEEKLPQGINPLSLHIMRLTSEYVSNSSLEKEKESDEESVGSKKSEPPPGEENDADVSRVVRKRTAKIKRFLGSTVKKTMHKAKSIAQEVSHARHKEDVLDIIDEVNPGEQNIKLKASNSHKGPYELENIQHVQEIKDEHQGAIWCMKFSVCGRLLATAGQDKVLRIWVINDAYVFFQDMRSKYNAEKVSPTPSQESLVSHHSIDDSSPAAPETRKSEKNKHIFVSKPFCTYTGHTSDLLDVSWSKNYFILSSSMDKTVRLWHISRKECLCCFQHIDFVTAIVFHPRDDRYFLSGSLDGKLRLWNIPDKKVAVWNEVEGTSRLITAANFCQNGKFAVVGSYDGRCIFYTTDQLKYYTQIHVRSTRGRNATGRKISGIEPMPGEDKILVTSNDSRIRLYDLRDLSLSCKYKGYVNVSSQIKASFSPDGKYIISGSENRDIYVWKTNHDYSKFSSVRRDRNDFWEAIKAHNEVVTCAIFAPNPEMILKMVEEQCKDMDKNEKAEKVRQIVIHYSLKVKFVLLIGIITNESTSN
ncbi:WD repeat-containing protein 44 isoform X2 [Agrilus planipennis]|uniref:WD repeat-containing protein 44 n=1 Tax=Agrilus planipennis TaxID=224129 RepID=A0A7F5RFM1_AGRPL|nr:WD repeat-containing protein 44 isoform X2 [Agrilus planipennis]